MQSVKEFWQAEFEAEPKEKGAVVEALSKAYTRLPKKEGDEDNVIAFKKACNESVNVYITPTGLRIVEECFGGRTPFIEKHKSEIMPEDTEIVKLA